MSKAIVNKNATKKLDKYPVQPSDLPYIRATATAELLECPRKFAAKHLNGLFELEPEIYQIEPGQKVSYGLIGTVCHEVIEQIIDGSIPAVNEYPHLHVVPEDERKNLYDYVERMTHHIDKGETELYALEYEFTLDWASRFGIDAPPIRGHIDMLEQHKCDETIFTIVDHKTNRQYEDVSIWRNKPQQRIYAAAIREHFGAKQVFWRIGYVNQGIDLQWESFEDEDNEFFERLKDAWLEFVQHVRNHDELDIYPAQLNKNCGYCPLKDTCETYKTSIIMFDQSMHMLDNRAKYEKYDQLKIIKKLVDDALKDVEEEITNELSTINDNTNKIGNRKYVLTTGSKRACNFSDLFRILRENDEANPQLVADFLEEADDILSVKVGSIDTFHKKHETGIFNSIIYNKPNDKPSIKIIDSTPQSYKRSKK